MTGGEAGAAAALALVGARFRLRGREAASGVDCVGVAAAALRAQGYADPIPRGYALRGGRERDVAAMLDAAGVRCTGDRVGDVLLFTAGPGQWHLAVRTAGGIVHADAALRRVVERPGTPPWPLLGGWRHEEGD